MGPNGNVKYVISSLRQQMMAYDLRLQEKPETAEFIVEGRIGVLANDGYEVTYGIPGNAAAASATVFSAHSRSGSRSGMPELSLGRRNHQAGTAKVGLFAYDRVTREPVWQAGVKPARATSAILGSSALGPTTIGLSATKATGARREKKITLEVAAAVPLKAYSSNIVFEAGLAAHCFESLTAASTAVAGRRAGEGRPAAWFHPADHATEWGCLSTPPHGANMPLPLPPRPQ